MSLHRRNPKRDASEKDIVEYLRKAGWSVLPISVRNGPDLVAAKYGITVLIECKTGKGKLKPGQQKFRDEWQGPPPYILRCVEDAQALTRAVSKVKA